MAVRAKKLCAEDMQLQNIFSDGFVIAEKDLELRGPGELLGTRQIGDMQLQIADLQRDTHLLPQIKKAAESLIKQHPKKVDQFNS